MPKVMLPLAAQPLWMPTDVLAAGPWEPVCAPVRLAAAASSVSFASIPAAYVMFRLRCEIINDATQDLMSLRLNNDSAGNYAWQEMRAGDTSITPSRATAQTEVSLSSGVGVGANSHATFDISIAKPIAGAAGLIVSTAVLYAGASLIQGNLAAIWNNTAALINRIDVIKVSGNFAANSIFILEGSRF